MFEGAHTALVTPFLEDGLDEGAYRQLIADQIEAGIQGIVPVGTTAEDVGNAVLQLDFLVVF